MEFLTCLLSPFPWLHSSLFIPILSHGHGLLQALGNPPFPKSYEL